MKIRSLDHTNSWFIFIYPGLPVKGLKVNKGNSFNKSYEKINSISVHVGVKGYFTGKFVGLNPVYRTILPT